ncbi:hypothetical protein [Calidithermus roseus]|uniref:DUF885 domain-containing protein n=1 Tax=Calidithermus roseus TaxID=1644118 RepID=A0A399EKJ1_9DEIN|nr:hypothetical protein [Calidithermus roseus]RIH83609.1 hypothetical protein Mrose_02967 [Calidithermus roseus]
MTEVARSYIELAHGIEQHFPGYIDAYFGPEDWKPRAKLPLAELSRQAEELFRAVECLEPSQRRTWLKAQVAAMQTTLVLLQGERLPYREEVRRLYDVEALAVPEVRFEEAMTNLEALLPGQGDLNGRLEAFRRRFVVPPERVGEVLEMVLERLGEQVRGRYGLPEGESFTVELVKNQPWGAYNWYLGAYRSRIELNTDLPTYLHALPDTMAHEGYPGHHTEHVLKEQRLYGEKGHAEASIFLINSPECVIAEGIAVRACEMVLGEEEQGEWLLELAQHLGLGVGRPEVEAMQAVMRQQRVLKYVSGNAALLFHEEKRPEAEVLGYIEHYALATPERARKSLEFIANPTWRSYVFTYTAGGDLLDELFRTRAKAEGWFRRLLEEPATPGMVRAWTAGKEGHEA